MAIGGLSGNKSTSGKESSVACELSRPVEECKLDDKLRMVEVELWEIERTDRQ